MLIVNPNAGRLTERVREDVVTALGQRFNLDIYSTTARDKGISLAANAAASGVDLVIAFGGDGHINEVANGLAGTDSTLGIIPGGTMNVFARTLGIPRDPLQAVHHLLETGGRRHKRVPLGRMDDRYFTFSAGCGFDAEAAERVERYLPAKQRFGEFFFFWSAFRVLASSYRHRKPSMLLRGSWGEVPVSMAIVSNSGPYAYLGPLPIQVAPEVKLDAGIDVFALKRMRVESLPIYTWRVLISHDIAHHGDVFYASDLGEFELSSDVNFPRHVDGEPLPPAKTASFKVVPDILAVWA